MDTITEDHQHERDNRMANYRDDITDSHGLEIGSVVGCGLDRLDRDVTSYEIDMAIAYYKENKAAINEFPIGARRQAIHDYVSSGFKTPNYLKATT